MSLLSFNVCNFGAVGDGITKDTKALQQTINSCAEAGGGTVIVPSGSYLCGTIHLKSNVELHLSAGATILGSPDREDYNSDDIFLENGAFFRENVTGAHLIIAYCQENISITGTGTIDGNSSQFFGSLEEDHSTYRFKQRNFPIISWRPGQMIFLCRCKKINVDSVTLNNSTYWNLFLLGCEDAHITGLTITNPPATQNGDGIDIDCSRNVTISDCIIRSGDDCITIRANKRMLGENAMPCENVTVTNCVLSTPCNAIRIGVGDGYIKRCSLNNMIIADARTAISLIACYSLSSAHGAKVEQIQLSNFIINAIIPFSINTGESAKEPASINDINFNGFNIKASAGSQIIGNPDVSIQNIRLYNFDWKVIGGTNNCTFVEEIPKDISHFGYHGMNDQPALPCAIYMKHLQKLTLSNIRVSWEKTSAVWNDGIFVDGSSDVEVHDVRLRQPKENIGVAIRCRSVDDLYLKGCQAETGTNVFLKVEDSPNDAHIHCINNDLTQSAKAFEGDVTLTEVGNLL